MNVAFNPLVGFVICYRPEVLSRKYLGWAMVIWVWKWTITIGRHE